MNISKHLYDLILSGEGGGISGGTNLGIGVGVYDSINNNNLQFRSILGSGNTTVSISGDTIVVESSGGSITVDTELNTGSTNPVQNQAIATVINQILDVIAIPPTYTPPTVSITNVTQTVERGTTLSSFAVNTTFVQNDAGAVSGYELCRNGSNYSYNQNNSVTESNITSAVSFVGKASYADGVTKNNNIGIPDPTGKILAGTISSAARTITPQLRQWWGGGVEVDISAEVRALPNNNFATVNSWTIYIDNTIFVVAIPATKTMTSALTSNNEQIVGNFNLTTFDVNDAGSNPISYRIYTLNTALPLNLNTAITLT
jgi:hypothetical protein